MKRVKNNLRILGNILSSTGASKVLASYVISVLVIAALIWMFEPEIHTYRDSLWYCYAVISTAGFGDVVTTALIPRILSLVLTVYSVLVIAIVTGVVVNYYTQMIEIKNKETMQAFLNKLEHLEEMSPEELKELSGQVRKFRANRQKE